MIMQMAHAMRHVGLFDHEADIDFRSTLGNHADVNASRRHIIKDIGSNARLSVNVVANQANDRLLIFSRNFGDLF